MDTKKASKARREAGKALAAMQEVVEQLRQYRRPLTSGRLQEVRKTCGSPGCKCARGEKHTSQYLYVSRGGPLRRLFVPKAEVAGVRERSERYGDFRGARAALGHAYQRLLSEVDALEAALIEPYQKVGDRQRGGE
jgi:hypothetical protein